MTMLRARLVVSLLVHRGGLVKTRRFRTPTYVGDPINAVRIFNEKRADELILSDIDASTHGNEPNYRLIEEVAAECRMPLCYAGGVTTIEQARRIFDLGVEKVALGSAAVATPSLLTDLATRVGTQSVVLVLDIKKRRFGGRYHVRTHNGTRDSGADPCALARRASEWGVGELVVNAIDNDGEMQGYDARLVDMIRDATALPLTVLGGAGSLEHIEALIRSHGVIGAAAGSLFVYKGKYRAVLINYPDPASKTEMLERALREFYAQRGPG